MVVLTLYNINCRSTRNLPFIFLLSTRMWGRGRFWVTEVFTLVYLLGVQETWKRSNMIRYNNCTYVHLICARMHPLTNLYFVPVSGGREFEDFGTGGVLWPHRVPRWPYQRTHGRGLHLPERYRRVSLFEPATILVTEGHRYRFSLNSFIV